MRVLFYGACHANALNQIFTRFGPAGLSSDLLHSFQLIGKHMPFPYDSLDRYDAVVFSPIFGRGEWDTAQLVAVCRDKGIRTVAYPLIEWRGYFPGFVFAGAGRDFRYYTDLLRFALEHTDFAGFEAFVVDGHTIDNAEAHAAQASAILRRGEEIGDAQISVASLIDQGFRDQRLMLTPQHPSRVLYSRIVDELEKHLGIRLDPSFHYGTFDPQEEAKDPLLPATIRALGLRFTDCEFRSYAFFGDKRTLSLRQWLRMYFFAARKAVTFEARSPTHIKRLPDLAATLLPQDRIQIKPGDTIIALEDGPPQGGHQRISVLGGNVKVPGGTDWFLYPPAWRRFDFRPSPPRKGR